MYFKSLIICWAFSLTLAKEPKAIRVPNGVVGGRDPKPGEVKYIVAIHASKYLCGGGIISDKHVLTAAHCVITDKKTGKLLKPVEIVAGTNVAYGYNPAHVIVIDVARAFLPSLYYDNNQEDIAVLELKKKFDFLKYHTKIQKLELPQPLHEGSSEYPSYANLPVVFAGYGNTRAITVTHNGKNEIIRSGAGPLKVAEATIVDSVTCRKFFKRARTDAMCLSVTEDVTRKNPQGTCSGDSGSPAVYKGNVLIGLDSMGIYCNNNRAPSQFTRVSTFIPFIKKAMSGDTDGLVVYEA